VAPQVTGFITIVGGTFLLHTTKDLDLTVSDLDLLTRSEEGSGGGARVSGSGAPVSAGSGRLRNRGAAQNGVNGGIEMGKGYAIDVADGSGLGDEEQQGLLRDAGGKPAAGRSRGTTRQAAL
jgi:hypothetical protein